MSSVDIIQKLQSSHLRSRFAQAGISHLRLFGSASRDQLQKDSDIDLLYDFQVENIQDDRGVRGLYDELSEQLGYSVELIYKKNIDLSLQQEIFNSMIPVF